MREIYVEINGQFIEKSSKFGGVVGEGNVTKMRLVFDESWSGYGKRIVWRNALGHEPVSVVLGYDLMTEEGNLLDYTVLIPPEPLAYPGWCSFTVEGYSEDNGIISVAFTVSDRLEVREGGYGAPAEPTPSQTLQLQYEIDGMIGEVTQAVAEARDGAERAEKAAAGLEEAEKSAAESALSAGLSAGRAEEAARNAEYWAGQTQTGGAASGVASFNGRSGIVLPQSGDYTASMVGADASGTAESIVNSHKAEHNPHSVSWDMIGAAAASHTHQASDIKAGTLGGKVLAGEAAQADVGAMQIRNISAGTTDLTSGVSALASGQIYIVYEEV